MLNQNIHLHGNNVTGIKPELVTQVAREFAQNAIDTKGRSMIIMGAGINHWFNSDTIYRAILNLVLYVAVKVLTVVDGLTTLDKKNVDQ